MKTLLVFATSLMIIFMSYTPAKTDSTDKSPEPIQAELIKRGEYLVTVGGCNDCHTPKIFTEKGMDLDRTRLMSGYPENAPLLEIDPKALTTGNWVMMNDNLTAFIGPWGMSYSQNLTPHENGSLEAFAKVLRTRMHMGAERGRPIMPPMPWINLTKMDEQDYKVIFTYFQSLPPINNHVPAPMTPEEVPAMAKK